MAYTGQTIENPVTGHGILFVETHDDSGGASFELEWTVAPHRGEDSIAHFHPNAPERFEILSGEGRYRLGGAEFGVSPGDILILPAGITHVHPWSVSDEELRYRQRVELSPPNPKMIRAVEDFFETMFRLAREGRTMKDGTPRNPLYLAVILAAMHPEVYLAKPSVGAQRFLFGGMAKLGRMLGYGTAPEAKGGEVAHGM